MESTPKGEPEGDIIIKSCSTDEDVISEQGEQPIEDSVLNLMNNLGQPQPVFSAYSQRPERNSVINDEQSESVNSVRLETGTTAY
jgi:hypothetical protein